MTPNLLRRIAEWWNRPPAPACYDCGTSIIAADDDAPLTAEEVRKIVREEIERALRPAGKSGKMGPG